MAGGQRNATLLRERFDRGLTVEQAAKRMKVSTDLLRRAEMGQHRPRPAAAKAIADFYGFKPSELWPIEGDHAPESKEVA